MTDILFLDPGHAFGLENRTSPFMTENFTIIDQYAFAEMDLSCFKAIVVHDFIDQIFMEKHKEKIADFLNEGKIVVWGGHLATPWLPGCPLFTPAEIKQHSDYRISIAKEHPIFAGVDPDDMTYNKGVAGFFSRGSHTPVPADAEVLLLLAGEIPITYIDRKTTKGTIFVHAGRDLFAQRMQEKSTDRISEQLLQWIHEEYGRLQEDGNHA